MRYKSARVYVPVEPSVGVCDVNTYDGIGERLNASARDGVRVSVRVRNHIRTNGRSRVVDMHLQVVVIGSSHRVAVNQKHAVSKPFITNTVVKSIVKMLYYLRTYM